MGEKSHKNIVVSSIVNEVIKTISIFLRKTLNAQKRKLNQNELKKQK